MSDTNKEQEMLNDPAFKGAEFFFEADNAALNEGINNPADIVTVDDFIEAINQYADNDDKVVFRINKQTCTLTDIRSKGGICVFDFIKGNDIMREDDSLDEGYGSWRRGGYGGTGRSYSSLGSNAPRGAAIGWYSVSDLDPKAKGKMPGWRCGPSNFPFEDLLYPDRKYKIGTMVMRNKYIKAGALSGEKYIAVPSYFDALKNNDKDAIAVLNALGIPLDLTFGMDPNDDYSVTYS